MDNIEIWKIVLQSGVGGMVGVASFFVFQYFNKRQDEKEKTLSERYEKTVKDLTDRYEAEKKDYREREEFLINQLLERVDSKTYQVLDIIKAWRTDSAKNHQTEALVDIKNKLDNLLLSKPDETKR